MSRFELTPIPEHEFPTLGRSFADRIIDEMLATEGNTFRLKVYRTNGELADHAVHQMLAATLKDRIKIREVGIGVGFADGRIYLRRSCSPH